MSNILLLTIKHARGVSFLFFTLLLLSINSIPVQAIEFSSGDFSGSFDTTLTYGQIFRTQSVDSSIVAISNAGAVAPSGAIPFPVSGGVRGTAFSANFDDGNTNFQDGFVSNVGRFLSELDVTYKDRVGAFVRVSGFKDFKFDDPERDNSLTNDAERLAGNNARLLDAYAWGRFEVGDIPGEIRVGEQVISWGESTFIPNSINVINPFDVTQLRVPGSELREALVPVGIVSLNLGVTDIVSVEGFYQYDYEDTELEPVGTFFSTNDFAADGGRKVQLGAGALSDRGSFNFGTGMFDPDFASVPRGPTIGPDQAGGDQGGQFGAAVRLFVEELNNTEFGLFYIRYHSRTPVLNVTTGSAAGAAAGLGQAIACAGSPFCPTSLVSAHAIDGYADTANYFTEFREDIDLIGLSFNTELGQTGIALQGEYSFRNDVPIQIDDAELLAAGLQPLEGTLSALAGVPVVIPSQVGRFGFNEVVPGFVERNVSQIQMTATKVFGPMLKASQAALIAEFAVTHVHGLPSKDELRFEAPGTFTGGNPTLTALGLQPATEQAKNFADATSVGYQIRGRLDYLNAIGAVNISPRFAWRHDVNGIAPVGLSGFRENSKAITLGVSATYLNEWEADVSYTNFFGAGSHNLLNDRDFLAFSISYSF